MNLLPFLLAVFLTTSSVACGGAPFTTLDPSTSTPSDDGGPTPTTDAPLGAPPSPASDAPFDADRAPPPDAALPLACLPSLTAVGQGDFRVAFDLQITHSTSTVAILSQRLDCAASSSSWTVTMTPAGGLVATV
jgi:hypothetical protein